MEEKKEVEVEVEVEEKKEKKAVSMEEWNGALMEGEAVAFRLVLCAPTNDPYAPRHSTCDL